MAKKHMGKFIALAAVTGAIAAGVSYFFKYRSFNKELDEEFHDFEDDQDAEEFDGILPHEHEAAERTYVTIGEKKADETVETAQPEEEAPESAEPAEEPVEEPAEAAPETTIEEDTVQ